MAHKWAKYKGKLDPFAEEPEFQRNVDAAKMTLVGVRSGEGANLGLLGKLMVTRRLKKDELEAQVKRLNVEIEALGQLIKDRFEEEGQDSAKLQSGATIYTDIQPYSSVQDRKLLMDWIEKHQAQYMLSIQWNTMNAFVKDQLEKGNAVPPGIKVFLKSDVRVKGIGGKK